MKTLLVLFVLTFVSLSIWADPIEVWDQDDLFDVRYNPTGDYVQMADIDLVGDWISISTFSGTYNGNGFYIDGISPNGLFHVINGATIENVKFTNVDIHSAGIAVGTLAGHAIDSIIKNCYTSDGLVDIYSTHSDVGGIVGILENSYMEYCYNTVNVRGYDRVGGLVGIAKAGSHIYRCFNVGAVVDSDRVGGLVGLNEYGSIIEECYAANTVQGQEQVGGLVGINYGYILNSFKVCDFPVIGDYVGGLVGLNLRLPQFDYEGENAINGLIENCYTNAVIEPWGEGAHLGGLIGFGGPGGPPNPGYPGTGAYYGEVINSYWDADISPGMFLWYWPYDPAVTGYARTTEQMTLPFDDPDTYVDWDGWGDDHIWKGDADLNREYPILSNIPFLFEYDCPGNGNGQPVELSSFTANVVAAGSVILEWRAETETNVLGYNVFRSDTNNLNDAVTINPRVIVAYNSSMPVVYSYLDEEVLAGTTYNYWLQSVDLDLTTAFHGPVVVTIEETTDIPDPIFTTYLKQNEPNPFVSETKIAFSLSREDSEMVELKIYNVKGQLIRTLHNDQHPEGTYEIQWNGRDDNDRVVPSGIYFYRLRTPNYDRINKMMFVK
ncbi:MAG: T9SS type A sorting domain-containing protein [Candidatus Cloacimonetes bacterium]|nr:T9SS type A sorting domain-containing protein [Candidatus Cloacimonadota bacterium]